MASEVFLQKRHLTFRKWKLQAWLTNFYSKGGSWLAVFMNTSTKCTCLLVLFVFSSITDTTLTGHCKNLHLYVYDIDMDELKFISSIP